MPELIPMSDLCYLSNSKEEFLSNIEKALNETDNSIINRRMEFAKRNTWQHRFEKLYSKMNNIKSFDIKHHN